MKFLFQNNLLKDITLAKLREVGQSYPVEYVDLMPFCDELEVDGVDWIPYGSTVMTDMSFRKGFKGLSYNPDTFKYSEYAKNQKMVNGGIYTLLDAIDYLKKADRKVFCKPNNDSKHFTGMVEHSLFFLRMLEDMYEFRDGIGTYGIDETFEVVISEPKEISMEVRWFIVDGNVIDGSIYRIHNQQRNISVAEDGEMFAEAQRIADIWLPHQNVVMDIGLIDGKSLEIVEFNCINSSGFYAHDTMKIFKRLYEYYTK